MFHWMQTGQTYRIDYSYDTSPRPYQFAFKIGFWYAFRINHFLKPAFCEQFIARVSLETL